MWKQLSAYIASTKAFNRTIKASKSCIYRAYSRNWGHGCIFFELIFFGEKTAFCSGQNVVCENCIQQRSTVGPDLLRESQQTGQKVLTKYMILPQAFCNEIDLTFSAFRCHFQDCYQNIYLQKLHILLKLLSSVKK